MAVRKLRPYSQDHTIRVLTDHPLRQVLHKPDTSGQLVKWAVELSEFDIQYMPRPAIKAQVLPDFAAECTIPQQITESEVVQTPALERVITTEEQTEDGTETEIIPVPAGQDSSTTEPLWEVYVDRSSNKGGCGAGLVLTGPDNFTLDYALRFGFHASNNEAEYEALLAGMNFAVQTSAQRLKAYCDSQLGIKKRLDEKAGRWADELYHVLWAYCTTPRTSTGESPFNLSFGTEAVIPVDVGAPSPRVTKFDEKLNGDGLRANLDLLE
ncbi:uncharacterized protein LOC143887886 [Tasmannia lanceolata]|uniref:uncharacterized protein LOC143887886 n=1 Tax=Tasmannia lanceolata TaxID=3420 RepID=UPI0040629E6B